MPVVARRNGGVPLEVLPLSRDPSGPLVSVLSEKILNLPAAPGVYLFKDARGEVLYVGKAQRLSSRVRSYLAGDSSRYQIGELMAEATDLDVILTDSEVEALLLESTLVRQHKPRYNIELKDDKSFPYVRISVQSQYPNPDGNLGFTEVQLFQAVPEPAALGLVALGLPALLRRRR